MVKRLKPLNDFAFQKSMGEKGDEEQLLAFLNAVLRRTGKDCLASVEILENKDLPAAVVGGKARKLDVLAILTDNTRVNIEVQLENLYNMEKRSLDYWAGQYIKGIEKGQDYIELPPVIAINILGFEYIPLDDFHTSFHIYEDRHKEYQLTDALELHFLDMIKFRRLKDKNIVNEPLHRWLVYFDEYSPQELVEEVIKMDPAIQKVQSTLEMIQGDPALLRAYQSYEKAERDELNRINGTKREIARKMKGDNMPLDRIGKYTGLSIEEIAKL
jgi:predicted transposase/invertase (TIGR01784 family)